MGNDLCSSISQANWQICQEQLISKYHNYSWVGHVWSRDNRTHFFRINDCHLNVLERVRKCLDWFFDLIKNGKSEMNSSLWREAVSGKKEIIIISRTDCPFNGEMNQKKMIDLLNQLFGPEEQPVEGLEPNREEDNLDREEDNLAENVLTNHYLKEQLELIFASPSQSYPQKLLDLPFENGNNIAQWLSRMESSAGYKRNQIRTENKVREILNWLANATEEFQSQANAIFCDAGATCEDLATVSLNNLFVLKKVSESSELSLLELKNLVIGIVRYDLLEEFARQFYNEHKYTVFCVVDSQGNRQYVLPDETEIVLHLQADLKDELNLPTEIIERKYKSILPPREVENAKQYVQLATSDNKDQLAFLMVNNYWVRSISKNKKFLDIKKICEEKQAKVNNYFSDLLSKKDSFSEKLEEEYIKVQQRRTEADKANNQGEKGKAILEIAVLSEKLKRVREMDTKLGEEQKEAIAKLDPCTVFTQKFLVDQLEPFEIEESFKKSSLEYEINQLETEGLEKKSTINESAKPSPKVEVLSFQQKVEFWKKMV